jgi:hypothetical protein
MLTRDDSFRKKYLDKPQTRSKLLCLPRGLRPQTPLGLSLSPGGSGMDASQEVPELGAVGAEGHAVACHFPLSGGSPTPAELAAVRR